MEEETAGEEGRVGQAWDKVAVQAGLEGDYIGERRDLPVVLPRSPIACCTGV